MKNKEIIIFLDKIRKRLIEYRDSKGEMHSAIRHDFCSIELAINFLELRIARDRKIKKEEFIWFEGKRYIQDTFGSDIEYQDIYQSYLEVCEIAKKLN